MPSLKHITNIVIAFLVMIFLFLIWQGFSNYQAVKEYHQGMANRTVNATANEISILIGSYRRMVNLFSAQHTAALTELMESPNNQQLADSLAKSLQMFLPEYGDFALAGTKGELLFTLKAVELGNVCRMELIDYARSDFSDQPVKIHTDEHGSHFDIVVSINNEKRIGIFFVSFMLERLEDILRNGQASGHHMLLLHAEQPNVLALALQETLHTYSMPGLESNHQGDFIRLLKPEVHQHIIAAEPIEGTQWLIADLPDADLYARAKQAIIIEHLLIFIVFFSISVIMLMITRREMLRSGETALTIEGIEAERRRIAMDLHDQVLGELTHTGREIDHHLLASTDDPDMTQHINQIRTSLNSIADGIRTVIDDLHPQALNILGLEVAFRALLEKHHPQTVQPSWSLKVEDDIDTHLKKSERLNLYRILLEVSHNVLKHAQAEHFDIRIGRIEPSRLKAVVEDDGIGFNPRISRRSNSLGVANIQTRARMMHAIVSWTTPPSGKGTKFELLMDLKQ